MRKRLTLTYELDYVLCSLEGRSIIGNLAQEINGVFRNTHGSALIGPDQSAIEWSTIRHSIRDPLFDTGYPDIEPPTEFDNVWLIVPQRINDIAGTYVLPQLTSAAEANDVFTINVDVPSDDSSNTRHHTIRLSLPNDSVAGDPIIQAIIKV